MKFRSFFSFCWCLAAATPVFASENIIIGAKGGIYCKTADDLAAQIIAAMNGAHETIAGCGTLPAGTAIAATVVNRSSGLIGGAGVSATILGGAEFAFTTVEDAMNPAPAAPASAAAHANANRIFKVVGAEDVRASPAKWVGRDLAFTGVQVYWVQDDDVRFLTKTSMTIFGKNVAGTPKDIEFLRSNCETSKEAHSAKCRVNIHFSYSTYEEDQPSPMFTRLVIETNDISIIRR